MNKLVFFGTSPRSAKFLELAIQNGLKFDLVVSEPAKVIGRKKILTENPTVCAAKERKVPYLLDQLDLLDLSPATLGLILDFNKIIPKNIIDHFAKGIINIHFSRLPQYRGPAPVQYTILNGDKDAWITFYLISEKLDEGKILSQISLPLDFSETTDSLYEKLMAKAAKEAPEIIKKYLEDKPDQIRTVLDKDSPSVSYTKKLTTENCRIDWQKSPEEIERLIRTAYLEPGAWTEVKLQITNYKLQIKRLKILKAHLEKEKLILDLVQLEGKNPVTWSQFKQGYPKTHLS